MKFQHQSRILLIEDDALHFGTVVHADENGVPPWLHDEPQDPYIIVRWDEDGEEDIYFQEDFHHFHLAAE